MTNLTQKIDLSISPEKFVWGLKSEPTTLMLMHRLVRGLSNEVRSIIHDDAQFKVELNRALELISELEEYGFREEAKGLLVEISEVLNECWPDMIPYFIMQCQNSFFWFPYQKHVRHTVVTSNPFKGQDVSIEHRNESAGIIQLIIYRTADRFEDPTMYDVYITVNDLIKWIRESEYNYAHYDTADPQTGHHVQRTTRIPDSVLMEECQDDIIVRYIKDGYPVIVL